MAEAPKSTNASTRNIVSAAIGLLLIAGMVFFYMKYQSEKKKNETSVEEIADLNNEVSDLEKKVSDLELTIDDQNLKLEEKDKLLEAKYREIQGLLSQVGRAKSSTKVDQTRITELEGRLNGMMAQIEEYRKKIAQLEQQNQVLTGQVTELQQTEQRLTVEKEQITTERNMTQQQLEATRREAGTIKVANFGFAKVNKKGERDPDVEFKGGGLKPLKNVEICFDLQENQWATPGKKDVYIVVTGPGGQVVVNTEAGYSGSFQTAAGQKTYSAKTSVQYDNARKRSCINFGIPEKARFEPGTHRVYAYVDGLVSGEGSFEVKK